MGYCVIWLSTTAADELMEFCYKELHCCGSNCKVFGYTRFTVNKVYTGSVRKCNICSYFSEDTEEMCYAVNNLFPLKAFLH